MITAQMAKKRINRNKELQSYVIGLDIGDGNLSNPNGRAIRLRISCDKKYPLLIKKIDKSLKTLLPDNKVSLIDYGKNLLDISVYSNYLEELLGWKAKNGPKLVQNVSIPSWIKYNKKYIINCLRGLIETDGCIYKDRGYTMMMFTSVIPALANDVYNLIIFLGFRPHIYRLKEVINKKYGFKQKPIYHVRLSNNVLDFLNLIKPEKI